MTTRGRRVLVTGGAGFIGSHVCDAYLARGYEVTALDDLSSGRRENVPPGADFVELDVRSSRLPDLFRERRFQVVNHHAAQIDVRLSVRDPRQDASVNVDGLLNLLEASRESGVERFVYVSSGGVIYGEATTLPIPRGAAKLPLSPYGVSKLAGEHYLFSYRKVHGLSYAALRYSNVYGPRQDPHGEAGVVAIFARRLEADEPLVVFGDGEQTRDYVYVEDVAAANLLVSEAELPDPTSLDEVAFNVGTGEQTSVNELARTLVDIAGRDPGIERAPARPGELRRNSLDCRELRALGWRPRFGLGEGLGRTYEAIAGRPA
ncbi:MAG: NAD-dependent epimerase/dehydratase family protein [Gemmatimonadota bacterium]